jgi:tetratricopeptide (TPR) repeat protein
MSTCRTASIVFLLLVAEPGLAGAACPAAGPRPGSAAYYSARENAAYLRKDYDRAIAEYTEAIRREPTVAAYYTKRGIAWGAKKEYDRAAADCSRTIRLNPKDARAYASRAYASHQGEYDKAIADCDQAIRLEPQSARAYVNRGYAYTRKRAYDKAIADCTRAMRLDPRDASAPYNRGHVYYFKKQYRKALADCDQAIRLDPTLAAAFSRRAWLRATCPDDKYRDGARAVVDARRACELSGYRDSQALSTLAAAYAESGQYGEAVRTEKQALQDQQFAKEQGEDARQRIKLYGEKKPYRHDRGVSGE